MRFKLNLIKTQNAERITLNLISRQPHCFGNILAVFDTGSPTTIISAGDASLLKIPISNLERTSPIRGFGRGNLPCRLLGGI